MLATPATLDASYARCKEIHRANGRSYYLATKLLPRWKHRHVHALYGLTRYADDLVDLTEGAADDALRGNRFRPPDGAPRRTDGYEAARGDGRQDDRDGGRDEDRARRLDELADRFRTGLRDGSEAVSEHPILPAVVHTVATFGLDPRDFDAFFASMAMDLTRSSYAAYDDLLGYMEGSAAVIGTMMLPILAPVPGVQARPPARELGFAFQLTNFIRDVGEDLERGRIYLPLQDLERFGVTAGDLRCGLVTPRIRALLEFEMSRAQGHYDRAEPGIDMLAPSSRRCIRTAFTLYREILDAIRRGGYDVFHQRARVPRQRKLAVAAFELLRPAPARPPAGGHR